jgi:hypothetical protein
MKQMQVPEEMRVNIDFNEDDLPLSVIRFHPVVFRDGDSYCCLLGPNPSEGVFGCGKTAKEALLDWDINLQERIKEGNDNDEVTAYVKSNNSI